MSFASRRAVATAAVIALGSSASASSQAAGAPAPARHGLVPGRVIVRFAPRFGRAAQRATASNLGGRLERRLPVPGLGVLTTPPGESPRRIARRASRIPGVLYAEPDQYVDYRVIPNDPLFGQQWALRNTGQSLVATKGKSGADIDATPAWDLSLIHI